MTPMQIIEQCRRIEALVREKVPEGTFVSVEFRLNFTETSPYYIDKSGFDTIPEESSGSSHGSLEEALAELSSLESRIDALPSREEVQRLTAARRLGRAIDEAREHGLDVDGIAVSFRGIWENLIEHRP